MFAFWKRKTLRLSKKLVSQSLKCIAWQHGLALDQVEQLGGEVGDDHVRTSSPHAGCHLTITIKPTTITKRKLESRNYMERPQAMLCQG